MAAKLSGGGGLDPRLLALLQGLQQQQQAQPQAQGDQKTAPFGMAAGPSLDLLKVLSGGVGLPAQMAGAPESPKRPQIQGDEALLPRVRSSRGEALPEIGGRPQQLQAPAPQPPLSLGMAPGSSITPEIVRALFQQPAPMPEMRIPGMVTPPQGGALAAQPSSLLAAPPSALVQGPQQSLITPQAMQTLLQGGQQGFVQPPAATMITPPALQNIQQNPQNLITPPALQAVQQNQQGFIQPPAIEPPRAPGNMDLQRGTQQALAQSPQMTGQGPQKEPEASKMAGAAQMPAMAKETGSLSMSDFLRGVGGGVGGGGTGTGGGGTGGLSGLARPAQAGGAAGGGAGLLGLGTNLGQLLLAQALKRITPADIASFFGTPAGTVSGDPLGTGALATTSADITRPTYGTAPGDSGYSPQDYPHDGYEPDTATEPSTWDYSAGEPTGDTGIEPSTWDFSPQGDTGTEPSLWDFSGAGDTGTEPSLWDFSGGGDAGIEPSTWDLGGLFGFGESAGDAGGFDPSSTVADAGGGWDLGSAVSGLDVGGLLGSALPYAGTALSLGNALAGPDPGRGVANLAARTALNQGLQYLGNQTGATNWIGTQLGNVGDWASGLLGGADAGTVALGLAPSYGVLAADAAPALGAVAPSYGVLAADAAPVLGVGVGGAEASAGIMSGLAGGGGIPLAAAAIILTNILTDELNDPGGKVSAAQDANYLNQQGMTGWTQQLKSVHDLYPHLSEDLTDEQATAFYKRFRLAAKADQLMADPMANQGQNEYGVQGTTYGAGVANLRALAGPEAVRGTLFLQDLLARRGITPSEMESATPAQIQAQRLQEQATSMDPNDKYAGLASRFDDAGMLGGLKPLTPAEGLAQLGFSQDRLQEPDIMRMYGVSSPEEIQAILNRAQRESGGIVYAPDVMAQLAQIMPGNYEQGLLGILGQG